MQGPRFGGQWFSNFSHASRYGVGCKRLCINTLSDYSYNIECFFLALATLGATENIQYG